MPIIAVNKLTNGLRLAEDVYTSLGGLLFMKGTPVQDREKEFLEAFLITEVNVEETDASLTESKAQSGIEKKRTGVNKNELGFYKQFDKAVSKFKALMLRVQGGQNVPVLEVREVISPLLQQIREQPKLLLALQNISDEDSYAFEHSIAVGIYSYMIARWMKIPEREWMQVALAGTLLDVGKTKIDQRILKKPGKLTAEEFEEMKQHTVYGYQVIRTSPGLNEGVALAALQHHEREDGSGYPLGLPGNKLHVYSKIVAVADVFHAMSSNRIYKKALSPFAVVEQLIQDSFGKLDPTIVHTFVYEITQLSVGMGVELNDGTIGKIIFIERNQPTRPLIEANGKIINLKDERHLSIVRML